MLPPKSDLHTACLTALHERLSVARAGIDAAQHAANADTKSSAGDKYETGREMAAQERERHAAQLYEAQQLLGQLQALDPARPCDSVRPEAAVITSLGLFYVGAALGRLRTAEGQEFVAVSAAAPLVQALAGQRAGEEITFNGKPVRVLAVG